MNEFTPSSPAVRPADDIGLGVGQWHGVVLGMSVGVTQVSFDQPLQGPD